MEAVLPAWATSPAAIFAYLALVEFGLLVAVFRAMIRGDLIPRSTHEARTADLAKQGDTYRDAWTLSEQTADVQAKQLAEMIELGRTTVQLLRALPQPQPPPRRGNPR